MLHIRKEFDMENTLKFLQDAKTFYFGTASGDQPEIRPFGFVMEFEGKLYFGMGEHKNVYKQLLQNPKFVVVAVNGADWIRIRATAKLGASEEALAKAFEVNPFLAKLYNDETGLTLGLVEAADAEVEKCNMMGPVETYKL